MCPPPAPMTRARSTNARSLTDSTWLRMTRAVDAQLVTPMTMTMTTRVIRIPAISASAPTISRMIGARMIARTKVGRTRNRSVIRIRIWSRPAAGEPGHDPDQGTEDDGDDVASRPMTIDIARPPDRQVEDAPAERVGAHRELEARRLELLAGRRDHGLEWPDEELRGDGEDREDERARRARPRPPGCASTAARTSRDEPGPARPDRPRARRRVVADALMSAPAGRARRTGSRPRGWRRRP